MRLKSVTSPLVTSRGESAANFFVISLDAAVLSDHAASADEGDSQRAFPGIWRVRLSLSYNDTLFGSDQPLVDSRHRLIGKELALSEHPVKKYLFRIFDKLGISTRVELVLYAVNHGNHRPAEWLPGTDCPRSAIFALATGARSVYNGLAPQTKPCPKPRRTRLAGGR